MQFPFSVRCDPATRVRSDIHILAPTFKSLFPDIPKAWLHKGPTRQMQLDISVNGAVVERGLNVEIRCAQVGPCYITNARPTRWSGMDIVHW